MDINFYLDELHREMTSKFDELIVSAFEHLGYSAGWIVKNTNRISVDRIASGVPSIECMIYKIDGKQVFSTQQITKIVMESNIYKFVANWEVQYFKDGKEDA